MRPATRDEVTGVVLAGGLARRMSGDAASLDKGLQPIAGRPMADHVIRRLAPQVGALLVNANRNLDDWRRFGLPVVPDRIAGFAGPLAGLDAAMAVATTPWLVTAPCDSPLLPPDLVVRLGEAAARHGARVAVAVTGSQPHPVFALVDRTLAADLSAFLASGRRRIDAWYARLPVVEVPFDDERAFVNVNTLAELQALEPLLRATTASEPDPT